MSNARPLTRALNELEKVLEELKLSHTVNGEWPASELSALHEHARLAQILKTARQEFKELRDKELRLANYENYPED